MASKKQHNPPATKTAMHLETGVLLYAHKHPQCHKYPGIGRHAAVAGRIAIHYCPRKILTIQIL
ncbi:MAG: hypothetical protein ACI308_04405, partial [Muribaculaceae bacterium]